MEFYLVNTPTERIFIEGSLCARHSSKPQGHSKSQSPYSKGACIIVGEADNKQTHKYIMFQLLKKENKEE